MNVALHPTTHELELTRELKARRERVFAAWTDPEQMAAWATPQGLQALGGQADVRVGGSFRAGMRELGGQEHWVHGSYREIVEPERLVMTHGWLDANGKPGHMTLVTVTFEALAPRRTRMHFRQTGFDSKASRDGHAEGWTSSFDQLRAALERAGWRHTRQRAEVFAYLRSVDSHPTAEQVFAAVRQQIPNISLATVYKALEALCDAGLAARLADEAGGPVRYDGRPEAHYHVGCERTGRVLDLDLPYDPQLLERVAPGLVERMRAEGFEIVGHRLEVIGRFGE